MTASICEAAARPSTPPRRAARRTLAARPRHRRARSLAVVAAVLWCAVPAAAATAGGEHGGAGPVLFGLAVLVLAARAGGLVAERAGAPAVLGELLVGIGLANLLPTLMGGGGIAFVRDDPTLAVLAQIGVLILLFDVGLEADLRGFVRVGASAILVALIGMAVPLLLGWGAAAWLLPERETPVHLFVGATLAATSIGITARVLKDLGETQRREAQIILAAAVIDDILALVLLAVVTGAVAAAAGDGPGLSPLAVGGILARAAIFLAITVGIGHLFARPLVQLVGRSGQPGMLLTFGIALCFALAYAAELIGLADIVGAFAAGLMLDPYGTGVRTREQEATLTELLQPLSAIFVPLFFVLMGLQVHLQSLGTAPALWLGGVLVICAIAGKLVAGFGARGAGTNRLAVGIGMVPRGEVGLIFAGIGARLSLDGRPVLSDSTFSALVLMVVVTTLLAPIGLRWALRDRARR
jgi:Kef-type K+ transport system membrane component KefB